MRIVFLDKKTIGEVDNFNLLHKIGEVIVYDHTQQNDVVTRASGSEVVITNKVKITRPLIPCYTTI